MPLEIPGSRLGTQNVVILNTQVGEKWLSLTPSGTPSLEKPETQQGLKGEKIMNMPEYRKAVFSKGRAVPQLRIYRGCKSRKPDQISRSRLRRNR